MKEARPRYDSLCPSGPAMTPSAGSPSPSSGSNTLIRAVRSVIAAILAALPVFGLTLAPAGCAGKPAVLRIYFTTDVSGYLTPCG
jgi:hypothetical protein